MMRGWGPRTWIVVALVLTLGGNWWVDEGGWALLVGAGAACAMAGLTAAERRLWP